MCGSYTLSGFGQQAAIIPRGFTPGCYIATPVGVEEANHLSASVKELSSTYLASKI